MATVNYTRGASSAAHSTRFLLIAAIVAFGVIVCIRVGCNVTPKPTAKAIAQPPFAPLTLARMLHRRNMVLSHGYAAQSRPLARIDIAETIKRNIVGNPATGD